VLDEARSSDYVIWAVALLLYVWDSASLLAPRDLLLVESGRRRLAVRMSESPFTIAGRVLAFSPLLLPWRGAFVAPWGRPWVDAPALAATLQAVQQGRAALLAVRVLATWAFALLFVGAPLLTLLMGPNTAVLYTAMGLYPTVLVAIGCLWRQRGCLGGGLPARGDFHAKQHTYSEQEKRQIVLHRTLLRPEGLEHDEASIRQILCEISSKRKRESPRSYGSSEISIALPSRSRISK